MTTGIYKLIFKGTSKVYIGKGIDIEHRWANHKFKFINNTHTKKMTEAFVLYGMPYIEVLLECSPEDLNDNENEAIDIYNSVINGFNTLSTAEDTPDGSSTPGELHGMSKHSNKEIIEAFNLLLNPLNTLKYISNKLNISYRIIAHISNGDSHTWLKSIYPSEYEVLLSLKGNRFSLSNSAIGRNLDYPSIISPQGIEYKIEHLTNFAKEHSLDASTLSKVLRKRNKTHKGWKLA